MQNNNVIKKVFGKYGIYIVFLILFVALSIANSNFLSVQNILNLIRQISFNGILAIGMTFVIITGGIDLSVGPVLAFSALVAASLSVSDGSAIPLPFAILAGLAIGLACGAVNGWLVSKLNLPPFIVMLGTMTIYKGFALLYCGGRPILKPTPQFAWIGQGTIFGIGFPIFIYLFVILISYYLLHCSKFGRHLYAVGGNETAAKAAGINTFRIKLLAYVISGLFAAVVGITLASRVNAASPVAGDGYELDAIAAAVIGGTSMSGGVGTITGTIVGAFIIGIISNGLDLMNVSAYYQLIVKGVIIIVAVLLDRKSKKG